jgi:hypothetical protein
MQAWSIKMAVKDDVHGRAKGGIARREALSPARRKQIAENAAIARWSKNLPIATHEGPLTIRDRVIPCAVLDDGTRVLSMRGVSRAFGSTRTGVAESGETGAPNIPPFLTSKGISPFIPGGLLARLNKPILYRPGHGGRPAFGYEATLLPEICEVILDADKAGRLRSSQDMLATSANILIRGLAHTGIVALVDEATGYQEVRDKRALQAILDKYLRKELAAWAKRFPDEFYKEMFRLRKWHWLSVSGKRPRHVGNLTNDLIYDRLAPGIRADLERLNPKDETGRRRSRHQQWLTDDVGHPALAQHLHAVIGLMRASSGWDQFYRMMNRAFPKKGKNLELALDD